METKPLGQNISESNQAGVELLITDAKTALTLLDLAETSDAAEDRTRRIGEAHHAYQTIQHMLTRLNPTAEQIQTLRKDLKTIEARLKALGVHDESSRNADDATGA